MKIKIEMTKCRRCGKSLATTNKSIYGMDSLKAKWGNICADCSTQEERFQILKEQGEMIISK
jgi:hypothetical protein